MVAAVGIQASQAVVLAAGAYPAASVQASQALAEVASDGNGGNVQVTQAVVLVAAMGRTADPRVRAWTFTMDGHDFYVLRLGTRETLVFDFHAEQWYVWGSDDADLWRPDTGRNWLGGRTFANQYGSNVLVGDDGNGALYFLDPDGATDDDFLTGSATPRAFLREITGQVATRSFDSVSCYGVQLIGAIGETLDDTLGGVTLFTSDDQGHTYDEHDTITIDPSDYKARAEWWSLGSFTAPGRLFKVQDYGALHRIDFLEMIEIEEDD